MKNLDWSSINAGLDLMPRWSARKRQGFLDNLAGELGIPAGSLETYRDHESNLLNLRMTRAGVDILARNHDVSTRTVLQNGALTVIATLGIRRYDGVAECSESRTTMETRARRRAVLGILGLSIFDEWRETPARNDHWSALTRARLINHLDDATRRETLNTWSAMVGMIPPTSPEAEQVSVWMMNLTVYQLATLIRHVESIQPRVQVLLEKLAP